MNEEKMTIEWEHFPSYFRHRVLEIIDQRFPGDRRLWLDVRVALGFLRSPLTQHIKHGWADSIMVEAQPIARGHARVTLRWEDVWEPELSNLAAEIRRDFEVEDERDLSAAELEELWNSEAEEPGERRPPDEERTASPRRGPRGYTREQKRQLLREYLAVQEDVSQKQFCDEHQPLVPSTLRGWIGEYKAGAKWTIDL